MQKPKFKTTERAAWLFINTRLRPTAPARMERRTATRNGYLTTASRLLGIAENELPMPYINEPISGFIKRVKSAG
ncbi:MAG: hypothetical protein Q8Q09_01090 [Deltaproteobacteria bacterium]|nr:hypothetical protein [Deltaproteobacteria bacterium]